jgi:crotonobetainyl-CoA:carnitine CoA-transferase CaiB-like acyl-CoA transferase
MLLGDYGAEVVKVEPPGGDPARALPGFAVWNRSKQSVVADPSTPTGRARIARLLAGADVCIHASRPLVAESGNPGLVSLFMPPYTDAETPWLGGAESHELLTAYGGLSSRQSSFDGGPIHLVYPFALYQQGIWGAACAVAALVERQRSGLGQEVVVSGMHSTMTCSPSSFVLDPTQPPVPTNVGPGGRNPTYRTFKCGDGEWLFMAALTPKFQRNAFEVLGVGDLIADPRVGGVPSRLMIAENRDWVRELLSERFLTRPRDEWLELLEIGDCPAGPVYDRDEWLDHPQVVENGLRECVEDPERGRVTMSGLCLGYSATPGSVRAPAPRLGEHDGTAAGWEAQSIEPKGGPRAGGPLAGCRVLSLGTILAGPFAGALLAGLGADVIKVESPAGDAFRETGFVFNRGMRGAAIDLSKPNGQDAFHRLVQTADVVMDNSRLGVNRRLRVDYDTLASVNPEIITFSLAGFGERGPLAHKPAFDPVIQAMSGMMAAQGGDSDPSFYTIAINDVVAAATSVFGVCAALYNRGEGRGGQRITSSLVASSLNMQSGELVRYEGRPPSVVGGRDFAGPTSHNRAYRVADGWVRIQTINGAPLPADFHPDALATMTVAEALDRLGGLGVCAVQARQPNDVIGDNDVLAMGLIGTSRLADGREFTLPDRYARFSRTEAGPTRDTPGVGEHSREVLREVGLDEAVIDALVADGAVIEGRPFVVKELIAYR